MLSANGRLPSVIEPLLDEIGFGSFEGGPLATYREWAWVHGPAAPCPGGGESRAGAAARFADGLVALLDRPEETVFAVSHALPVRYVLDASDGSFPAARVERVPHATPYRLERVPTSSGPPRRFAPGPMLRASPIPPLVDDEGRPRCRF